MRSTEQKKSSADSRNKIGFLEKNLEVLRQKVPETAKWLESAPDPGWAEMISSFNGEPNLRIRLGASQSIAYDLEDPLSVPTNKVQSIDPFKQNMTLILGMGLGYIPQAVLNKQTFEKGHRIVVIEPNPGIIRLALEVHDFSEHLESHTLILAGQGFPELSQILIAHEPFVARGDIQMVVEDYTESRPDDYLPLAEHARRVLNQLKSNQATVSEKGSEIAFNEIIGLPFTVRARGIRDLHNMFRGVPAILVSTGPSLGKNIHLLKKAQDRAVIIATAQAFRSLLAYGVKPDFICTIDFGANNRTHLDGLMNSLDVPLVSLCRAQSDLMRDYQGGLFVNGAAHPNHNHYLHRLWEHKGIIQSGNSVAHLAFSVALLTGADPLIWVGQDLAVSDTTHFDQVEQNSRIEKTSTGQAVRRKIDPKSNNYNQIIGSAGNLFVPGYYGKQVPTMPGLLSFLTLFEQLLEHLQGRFINATEGGARIKGTEQMPLEEVIETVCTEPVDKSRLRNMGPVAGDGETLIDQVLPLLREEYKVIEETRKQAKRGLATNRGLANLLDRPGVEPDTPHGPFAAILGKNAAYSNAARDLARRVTAVSLPIHGQQNQIMRRDLDVKYKADDENSILTRIKRNRIILEKTYEASRQAKEHYSSTIGILERYTACRDAGNNTAEELLEYGQILAEMGDLRAAAETYRKATKMFPESAEAWERRGRTALLRDKFQEVEEAVENLLALVPEPGSALKLKDDYEDALSALLDNEADFELGIFVRPLVNIRTFMKIRPNDAVALAQLARAEKMMAAKIEEMDQLRAEMTHGQGAKEYRYRGLMAESKRLGREENDLRGALACLEEASELFPDSPEARWGYATTLHHLKRMPEALIAYEKLVADFPENPRFIFEHGLVLLHSGRTLEGVNRIDEAMRKSDRFDSYLPKLGDLYFDNQYYDRALNSYNKFLNKFKADYQTWTRKGNCLFKMGRYNQAVKSYQKALDLKPGFEPALSRLAMLGPNRAAEPADTLH